jgi:hypothetical protein
MKGKTLTGLLVVLGFGLGMVLLGQDRTISKLMETCGGYIANALGL